MYGMGLSFYQLPWQIRGCSHHLIPRIPTPDTHYYHFPPPRKPTKLGTLTPLLAVAASGGNGNNGGGWNNPFNFGSGSFGWWSGNGDSSSGFENVVIALFLTWVSAQLAAAAATSCQFVWEVKGGKRRRFIVDSLKDEFLEAPESSSFSFDILTHLLLPEGFPHSVTSDYLQYSIWRGFQGIASQLTSVLATQSLLYAVGLGKGAIPTAAALNWVLKDGFGYLSKILFSKYGRHFDVNPKPWRLFADLLENAAFGLEMLTPAFPHHFLLIGAAAGAGRSAAALIQAATRSCFYAGFAAQRNFAEVIAKGEAQGMVSKSIGILLGIALANHIRSSTSLALGCFSVVTLIHMFCNLKSYKSIELRTLNPYRASLVFSEYLVSGEVPPLKDVNNEEPLFPDVPFLNTKLPYGVLPYGESKLGLLSIEAKDAAAKIEKRLQLGSKLSDVVSCEEDVRELFSLYKTENYILAEHRGSYCVVLKENASPGDMLKALFHVNYLHWLERNAGITARSASDDCRPGGRLQMSLEYVQREFDHVKYDGELAGWLTDGLIARPLGNRICPGYETT